MPRGRKRSAAGLGKTKPRGQQTAVVSTFFPLIKKPMELLGKTLKVPGNHWGTSARAADANKMFVCVMKDFSMAHRFNPNDPPASGFLLTEIGEDGHCGGSSEDFWMHYPTPFLTIPRVR
ncbi:hypothetical protein AB1Y20_012036 [Prymnesium parvum]|uniref:Uncharacterized protein n=1 Tax=Prymnesium parvum TaxID=97485 RepID=A0AB34IQZ2_PRYPA